MITLINPLTIEERLSLTKLLGHDSSTLLTILASDSHEVQENGAKLSYRLEYLAIAIDFFERTVGQLSTKDELNLSRDSQINFIEKPSSILNILSNIPVYNFEPEIRNFKPFLSYLPALICVIHNFLKNVRASKRKLIIELTGFPETPTFIPEGSKCYNQFIAFRVCDKGAPFPDDKNPAECFTKCPLTGSGFGLYLTGLIAKVLRAPVEISSTTADTKVSFYHPIYPE